MELRLARQSSANIHLPSGETLELCRQTCSTKEAAEYYLNNARDLFSHSKIANADSVNNILKTLQDYVDYLGKAEATGDCWSGIAPVTSFENFHQSLAEDAAKLITTDNVGFDFAINQASQILRGYHSNGQVLDPELVEAMDMLFNGWLVKNNMLCEDGIIYEADKDGNKKKDAQGNEVRTPAETFRDRMNNASSGFANYVQQNNKTIQLTTNERTYPAQPSLDEAATPSN